MGGLGGDGDGGSRGARYMSAMCSAAALVFQAPRHERIFRLTRLLSFPPSPHERTNVAHPTGRRCVAPEVVAREKNHFNMGQEAAGGRATRDGEEPYNNELTCSSGVRAVTRRRSAADRSRTSPSAGWRKSIGRAPCPSSRRWAWASVTVAHSIKPRPIIHILRKVVQARSQLRFA